MSTTTESPGRTERPEPGGAAPEQTAAPEPAPADRPPGDVGQDATDEPPGVVGQDGAARPMGVVGQDGPDAPGPLARLRAGAGRRPVATGALAALLAAGAAFGGGFSVGRGTAPEATVGSGPSQDGFDRVPPGDGGAPPDGLTREGFGPGGRTDDGTTDDGTTDDGTTDDGTTDDGTTGDGTTDDGTTDDGTTDGGTGGVQDGSSP